MRTHLRSDHSEEEEEEEEEEWITQSDSTDPTTEPVRQHHQTPLTNVVILRVVEFKQSF